MALFDFFLSEDRKIQKQQRNLTNRDNQPDEREQAARWLSDNGSGKALVALLSRFEMQLEHQMHDRDEREFVYGLLMGHGEHIERPLRVHLKKCRKMAMPLRLYAEVFGEEKAIALVYDLLRIERERDDFKPQKKTDLLVWLVDHKHDGAIEAATAMLDDFDESVRYAAAEVILAQQVDTGKTPLESILSNPKEESNRLKVRLCEAFSQRRWVVSAPEAIAPNLPDSFELVDGRIAVR